MAIRLYGDVYNYVNVMNNEILFRQIKPNTDLYKQWYVIIHI